MAKIPVNPIVVLPMTCNVACQQGYLGAATSVKWYSILTVDKSHYHSDYHFVAFVLFGCVNMLSFL